MALCPAYSSSISLSTGAASPLNARSQSPKTSRPTGIPTPGATLSTSTSRSINSNLSSTSTSTSSLYQSSLSSGIPNSTARAQTGIKRSSVTPKTAEAQKEENNMFGKIFGRKESAASPKSTFSSTIELAFKKNTF